MRFRIEKRCRIYGLYAVLKAHAFVILDSSMVEHSAVNRRVVGSSPTGGATKGEPPSEKVAAHFFYSESQRRLGPLAQLVRADGS